MNNHRIIDILRSSNAVLVVLVLALGAQTPHAADVFRIIGHSHTILAYVHSYSFAIALELAVLVFVIQNKQIESYAFAGVSVAMNLSYYFLTGNTLFAAGALPDWLVSIALPVAIARYSHVVVEAQPDRPQRKTKPTQDKVPTVEVEQPQPAQEPDATIDKRQRATQLRSEGLSYAQIADELDVHRNTIANWLKATNGHKEAA